MPAVIDIPTVGRGHIELRLDEGNAEDRIRASRIIKDMLRRGYALLVEVEENGQKTHQRVLEFDETKFVYIIADFDPTATVEQEPDDGGTAERKPAARRGRRGRREIDATSTPAVGVARNSGG